MRHKFIPRLPSHSGYVKGCRCDCGDGSHVADNCCCCEERRRYNRRYMAERRAGRQRQSARHQT